MAENAHYHLEKMLPELKDLQERLVFSAAEIKQIAKKRSDLEFKLHKKISKNIDFRRYIEYETILHQLATKRKARLNTPGWSLSDYSMVRRIHGIYQKALRKFRDDIQLWVQYFEWSRDVKSSKVMGKSFAKAIQLHPAKPIFWIMAANWEFTENHDMSSARILMQRALRLNPKDESLWKEYFRLELLWLQKLQERKNVLFGSTGEEPLDELKDGVVAELDILETSEELVNIPIEASDPKVTEIEKTTITQENLDAAVIPRAVFRNAIKAIGNAEFRLSFIEIYNSVGVFDAGIQEVVESINLDFDSIDSRSMLAEQHILGRDTTSPLYPEMLDKSVQSYLEFLRSESAQVSIQAWERFSLFIRSQLSKIDQAYLISYLKLVLAECYSECLQKFGKLSLEMYVDYNNGIENVEEKIESLNKSIEVFPDSMRLWNVLIDVSFVSNDDAQMHQLFEKALRGITATQNGDLEDSIAIYSKYLVWIISDSGLRGKDMPEIDSLFQKSFSFTQNGLMALECMEMVSKYFMWLKTTSGEQNMQDYSDKMMKRKQLPQFYTMVIDFETKVSRIAKILDIGLSFYPESLDLWQARIKYEFGACRYKEASMIFLKAQKSLNENDHEEISTFYQTIKSQ